MALQNIVIIKALELEFQPGLNVITGETGSGKSLILDAIQRVFDKRSSPKDLLRRDTARGKIELTFARKSLPNFDQMLAILTENGVELVDDEAEILLSREITASTSRCRVNGYLVPLDVMSQLGALMLEIYGQHDLHTLFSTSRQRDLLDNLGGEPLLSLRREVRNTFRQIQQVKGQLETLKLQQQTRERDLDFIGFQLHEIQQAHLNDPEEDSRLKLERERLSQFDNLRKAAVQSSQILTHDDFDTPSVSKLLHQVQKSINSVSATDPQFSQWYEQVMGIQEELSSLAQALARYADSLDNRPERMQEIIDRLDVLEKLKRKYGGTLQAVMETEITLTQQLDALQSAESHYAHLETELAACETRYADVSQSLREIRQRVASSLEATIQAELQTLMLPAARFGIQFETTSPSETGSDLVTFMFSANPGERLMPLAQVASGGELSRLMLALKIHTAHADALATLILDEIDTGMSGVTVRAVGEKLQALQQQCQIIMITHQPIVAAKAGWHVHIQKHLLPDDVEVVAKTLTDREERKMILGQLASGLTDEDGAASQFVEQLLT